MGTEGSNLPINEKVLKGNNISGTAMELKNVFKEYILPLSLVALIVGIVLLVISVIGLWFSEDVKALKDVTDFFGDWNLWLVIISPFIVIAGGFYFGDTMLKRREFYKLINTSSKAEFIRNKDRIEFLAWRLTKRDRERYFERKKELKIK